MVDDGLLNRLDLAFSRDQAKRVYVQHKMLDYGAECGAGSRTAAHFYVCGDATPDGQGRRRRADRDHPHARRDESAEAAHDYKRELVAEKRYVRDVY